MDFSSPQFWVAVLQIIAIDIVLGGDNAVVIALACRHLPERQRNLGIIWGVAGAIGLRVILIFFALHLLAIPYLKVVGAALLVWIGVKMLQPEHEGGEHEIEASSSLLGAIKTVIIADAVMSLDNVIAIAGAAKGNLGLVIFGLIVSVPIIVWGSKFVMRLMDRFPIVIVLGGALLGWIAGDMTVTDVALKDWMTANVPFANWLLPVAGALLVVAVGKWLANRKTSKRPAFVELGAGAAAALAPHGGEPAQAVEAAAAPAPAAAPETPAAAPAGAAAAGFPAGLVKRVLLPVDGSDNAARAVEYAINMSRAGGDLEIHLVNVQGEVPADISRFVAKESIEDYHRENSTNALTRARKILDEARVRYTAHMLVGKPWDVISEYASANQCDLIVMGTRGLGLHTGALLGSVSMGVAQRSTVPVLLVK